MADCSETEADVDLAAAAREGHTKAYEELVFRHRDKITG
ncbi:MAG: hypothetical protein M2R45_01534 [Verrucomicrobia subdivision 3 bacterium]|nr:hypothetical protein [Limisphaerales bacterium]MCS1413338.1 hypothetical protein [Limisphaerales bacterium]